MSKTLTFKNNNHSAWLFDDSKQLTITETQTHVGDPSGVDFNIGDMDSTNSTLHEGVTAPANWQGHRYTFDGSTWTEIPAWAIRIQARIDELESEISELSALPDQTDHTQSEINVKEARVTRLKAKQ
tara:strand:+ start:452 stop:832 length:381 start_codon:yes stop_codon:yes gene_type:complete